MLWTHSKHVRLFSSRLVTKAKKQHWVPRFYLKGFSIPATKNSKSPKVRIFSKTEGDPKIVNIKDIAAKRYLYSPKDHEGIRSWATEDKLADLESTVSTLWPSFADGFVDLDNDAIRKCIALFLSTLILRHPSKLNEYRIIQDRMISYFESLPKDNDGRPDISWVETQYGMVELDISSWDEYSNQTDFDRKKFFVDQIHHEAVNAAKILMEKRWSVLFSDYPCFITTDRPVSILNQDQENFGISTKGTIIQLPISPTRVLVLDDRLHEPSSQYSPLAETGPGPINLISWSNAHEFMITGRNTDEVCEEMLSIDIQV